MLSRLILPIYYGCMAYILWGYRHYTYAKNYNPQNSVTFLKILKDGITFSPSITLSLFYLLIALCLVSLFYKSKTLRFVIFILNYVVLSYIYSDGKIHHSYHVWLISSLVIIFYNDKEVITHKKNIKIIRLIQTVALSHYIFSGLWKIRSLGNIFNIEYSSKILLDHIAFTIAEGTFPNKVYVNNLINHYPAAIGVLFISAVIIQLLCAVPIFFNKYFMLFGSLMIIFHLLAKISLGIGFQNTIYFLIYFFIIIELVIKVETKRS